MIDKHLRSGPYTYHIYLWNGFLKSLFAANMREIYKYNGKEGLEKAKYELFLLHLDLVNGRNSE